MQHIPVLLHEVIEVLDPKLGEFVIDGTLGAAGHARELIKRISPNGTFLGVDRDSAAVQAFAADVKSVKVFTRQANYRQIPEILAELGLPKANCLLLDLGFSSDQLGTGRGFSFQVDEPLIMTYDDEVTPVRELLKTLSEAELTNILREYGEERYAEQIAKSIWQRAKSGKMETTQDLVRAVTESVPKSYERARPARLGGGHGGRGRIHPATRTFQALRIYANQELESLKRILENLYNIISPGGRVAIISFHSLEDRIVKNYFRMQVGRGRGSSVDSGELPNASSASGTQAELITKKPITASVAEVAVNPRARSAKLRALKL